MKQLFKPLLTALLLLCSSVINAHDFEVDGIYYNILSEEDKTVEVTFRGDSYNTFNEYIGAVIIPVNVKYNGTDYSVARIGDIAFGLCNSLTSITIPNSVTSIESSAFYGCSGLTSITIPNSVTSIGSGAFTSCGSLKEIYLEDGTQTLTLGYNSITYNSNIGEGLFYDCPLEKLYLGRNLSYNGGANYGYSPFYNIKTLTTITIGNSVTSIGYRAFRNCTGLTSIIVYTSNTIYDSRQNCNAIIETASNTLIIGCRNTIIPNSITSIGSSAFYGCSGLTSITIPNSVTSIESSAFWGCSGLTSITIPNSVTSIGIYAFGGCYSLKELHLEDGTQTLTLGYNYYSTYSENSEGLFYDCPLEKLYLGRNLSYDDEYKYGYSPFYNIKTLTTVTIGNSVTNIGSSAFYECSSLTSIEIPNSVTNIGSNAFSGCKSLTSITIPNSVTGIGTAAFYNCISLKDVINFSNLTFSKGSENYGYIAYYANKVINAPNGTIVNDFVFCTQNEKNRLAAYLGNEKEITLPENYKGEDYYIGEYAFSYCDSLTSIIIPNSVTSIGSNAFSYCDSLTSIIIPNSVTNIGSNAFSGCKSLTSIEIPNSVTSIGNYAFDNCSLLKELHLEDGTQTLTLGYNYYSTYSKDSEGLFYDCPLEKLYLGRNLSYNGGTNYGYSPFYNIKTLTTITIGNSVTSIGYRAFYGCSSLTSITIPNSVTSIGSSAFSGCRNLTSITIPNSVTSIGNYAFAYCSNLTSITIPNSVTSIGDDAFDNCSYLQEVHINDLSAWCKIDFSTYRSNPLYYANNLFLNGNKVSEVIIPDDITEIKEYAFFDCDSLTSIIIPNSVTSIESSAFYGCSGLTSITIPNSVTSIGSCAFESCTNLEKLYLGNSIESIGNYAFDGCNSLLEIYASSKKAIECNEYVFSRDAYNNACLFVPTGRKFAYEKTTPWNNFYIVEMEFSDSYQLIYMVDGEVYKSFNLNYGAIIEPVAEPTKEGHTFSGWSDIPRTMPAKTVIVNGSFTPNSYTVAFKVDGAEYKVLSVVYGTAIPTIEAPTKEGHTFSGWSEIPETMPANDIVIEGTFSVNSYLLTYKVDGEIYATDSIKFGATIEPIAEPIKEGHTFSGWSEIPETMPANDVVIEGSFSINSYTVTFMVDGEVYKTMTVEYGAEIELPTPPEKEGYIFTGWIGVPATMPAEDIVIEGRFEVDTTGINAVTLDLEKNEVYNLKGQRITESENLTRGIYIVNGRKVLIK